MELKRTPLYERHLARGARIVDFAGYAMPLQYTNISEEHRTVREAVGVFDVSHMGEIRIQGPQALDFLQFLLPNDVAALEPFGVLYSPMCTPQGGTVDDLLVYRLEAGYLLVVNAANAVKDLRWIREHAARFQVDVTDESAGTGQLAVQGPRAEAALREALALDLSDLKYYAARRVVLFEEPVLVSRTGYTGEDGFELYASPRVTVRLWEACLAAGVAPIGLGARDSLRFEACLPLYGHELGPEISPVEAGLGWTVKTKDVDYLGKAVLLAHKEKPPRVLIGLEMREPGVPRQGFAIRQEGRKVGTVTSGMKAPSLGKFLALGLVQERLAPGTPVEVEIRGQAKRAEVIDKPFYRGSVRR